MPVAIRANPPSLPEPILPIGLAAYIDTVKVSASTKSILLLLRGAKVAPDTRPNRQDYYSDQQYPKLKPLGSPATSELWESSPCERDVEAMAIHRGFAWIAIGYSFFGSTMEGHGVSEGAPQARDLHIARHGRSVLLRLVQINFIADALQEAVQEANFPIDTRAEIVAFLKTLLAFKKYYDLLVFKGDAVLDWMSNPLTQETLVDRINTLLPSDGMRVNECLEGYARHVAILHDGRKFPIGSIYSNGIARYSLGFWWRREGEGTSQLAKVALQYALERLAR